MENKIYQLVNNHSHSIYPVLIEKTLYHILDYPLTVDKNALLDSKAFRCYFEHMNDKFFYSVKETLIKNPFVNQVIKVSNLEEQCELSIMSIKRRRDEIVLKSINQLKFAHKSLKEYERDLIDNLDKYKEVNRAKKEFLLNEKINVDKSILDLELDIKKKESELEFLNKEALND